MITRILEFFGVPTYDPTKAVGHCYLPAPPEEKPRPKAKKPTSSLFEINAEEGKFGFYHNGASERTGSVAHLTDWDMDILEQRDLTGGDKVNALNERCKQLWYGGEKQEDAERIMARSDSWVEKRYWAFASALQNEIKEK